MDIETFYRTYTPASINILKKFSEILSDEIKSYLLTGNHHVILKAKEKIDLLAECKMIINSYPACQICGELNCESDHK